MERILRSRWVGPHLVTVVEHLEDEGATYSVAVDGKPVSSATPLESPPTESEVLRLYALARVGK